MYMTIRASNIHRFRNCSGSPAAEAGIAERDPKSWTTEGTLIHAALESAEAFKALPDHLVDTAEWMDQSRQYLVDKVFPEQEGYEQLEVIREHQFFVDFEGERIISGHPDFVQLGTIFGKRVALILDFKAGFLEVPAPEANDQLRAYAVAVWQDVDLKIDEVYASIIPRFGVAKPPVFYSSQDLPQALLDLADVHRATLDAKATRAPSVAACRYCLARATSRCPETLNPDRRLKEMPSLIALSPVEKGELLDLCEITAGNIKALKERLYDELKENADAVSGWGLVPGDVRGTIADVDACYQAVSEMMTLEEFQGCLKVAQKPLKDAIKDFLGAKEAIKGKAAALRIKAILAPVTLFKQGEDRLERKA
jgi:hypothetical protein